LRVLAARKDAVRPRRDRQLHRIKVLGFTGLRDLEFAPNKPAVIIADDPPRHEM
jgi:hypothetical protein